MQKMTTRIDEGGKKGMRAKRGKKAGRGAEGVSGSV
jgi:hypothetical protein